MSSLWYITKIQTEPTQLLTEVQTDLGKFLRNLTKLISRKNALVFRIRDPMVLPSGTGSGMIIFPDPGSDTFFGEIIIHFLQNPFL
jgi:hypothetical protein